MGFVTIGLAAFLAVVGILFVLWAVTLRRVVPTNEVHIVQRSNATVSYGKDTKNGNTYWQWPVWIPRLGLQVIKLPVNNFPIRLDGYEAYDKDRLPFMLDLEAFFRISDANTAAQRVSNFDELRAQLRSILEGASRSMLASKDIGAIMTGRSEFGDQFTNEVKEQLSQWGVEPVKNIELMDIRDAGNNRVILNIMEKKKSEIERDSRITVAENKKKAEESEIQNQREVAVAQEQALQQVGIAKATKDMEVGLAEEVTEQRIKEQQRITTEKTMEVKRIELVKQAEIAKDVEIVKAQEQRATEVERAEGEKNKTVLISEGKLQAEKMAAEAVKVHGEAEAEALKLKELAPVQAQIALAQEIGENQGYQQYLISVRQIETSERVGIEQAKALTHADVKVIANSGSATEGLSSLGDLFTSKGGMNFGAMLEGLANTDQGKELLAKITGGNK